MHEMGQSPRRRVLLEVIALHRDHAEDQSGRVLQLHTAAGCADSVCPKSHQPVHLGSDVVGLDVEMEPRRSGLQPLVRHDFPAQKGCENGER